MRQVIAVYDVVGAYQTAWGGNSVLEATKGVMLVEWPGMILHQRLDAKTVAVDGPVPSGMSGGTLHVALGDQLVDVPLVTEGSLDPPGTAWRLFRINL